MKKIHLKREKLVIIGGLGLPQELHKRVEKIAEENSTSRQNVVRSIVETFIDEAEFI